MFIYCRYLPGRQDTTSLRAQCIFSCLLTVVAVGCGHKRAEVKFSAEELASERPTREFKRVAPPNELLLRTSKSSLPIPEERTCTAYCAHVMRHCTGRNTVYASEVDCISACRDADWSAGQTGDASNDSLACRLTWAKASAQSFSRCVDAGPLSPACLQRPRTPVASVPPYDGSGLCVMGLYDSSDQPSWSAGAHCRDVILTSRLAPIIADMGFIMRLHDVTKGLPSPQMMVHCRAIVTSFYDGAMAGAEQYAEWLGMHAKAGRRVVILNNYGAYQESKTGAWVSHDVINSALRIIGVKYDGQWTDNDRLLKVGRTSPHMFRTIPKVKTAKHYFRFRRTRTDAAVHLEVVRTDINDGSSAVVVTSPSGGMALTRYYEDESGHELLDLARFIRLSLSVE